MAGPEEPVLLQRGPAGVKRPWLSKMQLVRARMSHGDVYRAKQD